MNEQNTKTYNVVSFSGGKDSTAMLLHMLELGMQVDEIIFCDTGVEFPAMYEHINKVELYTGRKITRLKAERSYPYMLLEHKNGMASQDILSQTLEIGGVRLILNET